MFSLEGNWEKLHAFNYLIIYNYYLLILYIWNTLFICNNNLKNKIMRKTFLFILCMLSLSLHAQIIVEENGNVGVGLIPVNDSFLSDFSVNTLGSSKVCSYIVADRSDCAVGLRLHKQGTVSISDNLIGLMGVNYMNANKKNYGVYGQSFNSQGNIGSGRSYGVIGYAGNSTPGWNYGVCGSLIGTQNGAGVFGTSTDWGDGIDVNGRWAGFFHGNAKITGTLYVTDVNLSSDIRLKSNISRINESCLSKIMDMNVVQYNLKQIELNLGDTAKTKQYLYDENSSSLKKTHYGLIAQELKEIYPDLVSEGGDGFLSINYIEIIPLLISSIQELSSQLADLKSNESLYHSKDSKGIGFDLLNSNIPVNELFQNDPNPFKEKSIIKCTISPSATNAVLYIYDINGKQIDSIQITERGETSVSIEGNRFDAGIYIYSLIVDNVVIDSRRMILTK